MSSVVASVNDIPVRLTDERWIHIVENHNDVAGYYDKVLEAVANPKWIIQGYHDQMWAILEIKENKVLLVVYKEIKSQNDGFIITAFFTSQIKKLKKEENYMDTKTVDEIFKALPYIQKSGASHISFDFDEEADTLYISFEKPQNATDTDILEDGTFLRIRDDKIVGITITNFSQKYQHA